MLCAIFLSLSIAACGGGTSTSSNTDTSGSAQVTTLGITDTVVGTGADASTGKTASVYYTGWLYDVKQTNKKGSQFDSNVGKTLLAFHVGSTELIAGFDQGVNGMKVGGKRTVIIPANLAYGASDAGAIPANAAIVFDIELVSVQ